MKKKLISRLLCPILMAGFLLGIHNGRIAIWKGEDPEPFRTIPFLVSLLPDDFRAALQQGIPIDSMEDLDRFLTEYLP